MSTVLQKNGVLCWSSIRHPCPTHQLWPFSFPPENPPKSPKWGPQNEFPGISRIKGFRGNSTETLNCPAHPDFGFWGAQFSAFGGEMKLICWAALKYSKILKLFLPQQTIPAISALFSNDIAWRIVPVVLVACSISVLLPLPAYRQ